MVRRRIGGAVVCLALLAGACNGSTSADPSPIPSPPVAASPSPSPTPAASPSPTEVLPANDVDDPVEALEAIVRYRDHLFEHPDPEKLKLIYAERCECYEEVFTALSAMDQDGRRIEIVQQRAYETVQLLDRNGPSARIEYRVGTPGFRLLDQAGTTVEEVPPREPRTAEALLVREGGRWRVIALLEEAQ